MFANRALYHDGWVAACFHGRAPWVRSQKLEVGGPQEKWELYNIAEDFSQGVNLAAQHPDKLKELQDLFDEEAWKYNVYPLSSETTSRSLPMHRPSLVAGKKKFTYYRKTFTCGDGDRQPEEPGCRDDRPLDYPAGPAREGVVDLPGRQHGRLVALRDGQQAGLLLQLGGPR